MSSKSRCRDRGGFSFTGWKGARKMPKSRRSMDIQRLSICKGIRSLCLFARGDATLPWQGSREPTRWTNGTILVRAPECQLPRPTEPTQRWFRHGSSYMVPSEVPMADGEVTTERTGDVTVLRVDRPPVNAIDLPFARKLVAVLEETIARGDCGALVLTGREGSFSAGLDLKAVPTYGRREQREMVETINRITYAIYGAPCP